MGRRSRYIVPALFSVLGVVVGAGTTLVTAHLQEQAAVRQEKRHAYQQFLEESFRADLNDLNGLITQTRRLAGLQLYAGAALRPLLDEYQEGVRLLWVEMSHPGHTIPSNPKTKALWERIDETYGKVRATMQSEIGL